MLYRKISVISPAGARFSKVPKSFRARKATRKISNLKFTELFFSHIFNCWFASDVTAAMLVVKNKSISLRWEMDSILMQISAEKFLLYWPPTWPPCHVVANQEYEQIFPSCKVSCLYTSLFLKFGQLKMASQTRNVFGTFEKRAPGLIQLRKDFSVSKRNIFWQESVILASVVWLHVNNCCKGAVACLHQERGITGIMFCHQTGGPMTRWAYKREGL